MGGAESGPASWDDLLCFGYGVLRLQPSELYRVTPGELFDMAVAYRWAHPPDSPTMDSDDRAREFAKLDALLQGPS